MFLVCEGDRIKIGLSANSFGRIPKPKGAEVLVVLQGGRELKTHLMRRFGAYRLKGEWVADNPEIRAYIAERVEAGDNVSHRINQLGMTFHSYAEVTEGRQPKKASVGTHARRVGPTPGVRAGGLAQKRYGLDAFYRPREHVGEIKRRIARLEEHLEDYKTLLEEAKEAEEARREEAKARREEAKARREEAKARREEAKARREEAKARREEDEARRKEARRIEAEARRAPFPIVYFVRKGERIKIGFSVGFTKRMYQLQPDEVLLVLEGDRKLEGSLLRRFAAYHVEGEWFTDNPEIRDYIAECRGAGQNVPSRYGGRRRAY